jgi:DNA gyrase inhibitor GyrI
MAMKANHASSNNVISSDQKNTKLNNFRVMTCVVTIKINATKNSKVNFSKIESIALNTFLI